MIYFAQAVDGGPVKIGSSKDVEGRLKQLEAHYGKPLALLATREGGRKEEAEIHARFAHLRMGRTEQFAPGPDLMAFIGRPLFVNQGDVPLMQATGHCIRITDEAIKWARIAAGYTGESVTAYVNRIIIERAQEDIDRLYAEMKKGGSK